MDGRRDAPLPTSRALAGATTADLLDVVRLLPDVLFRCHKGDDGKIYWSLNEGGLAEEFGLTTRQVQGKSLEDLFPGGASDALKEHFEEAFAGRPTVFTNEMGGRHFRHYPQPVYDRDGKVQELVGFIADVTELVETERRLALANQDLRSFVHTLHHDVQNGHSVLQTDLGLLRRMPDMPPTAAPILERMARVLQRVTHTTEDVLHLGRSNEGDLVRDPVDLAEAFRSTAAAFSQAHGGTLRVEAPDRLEVQADRRLMRILVENMVGNTWKFTRGGEAPTLWVTAEERDGLQWVEVRDNGRGFPPEAAHRIFRPFQRAHDDTPGSGVGLATVHRIVERHGGAIEAEGRPGEGATFRFHLGR